ncbi:hypothetical protein OAH01_03825, partial [Akkermansiaceae bacterium]|nr:hypothetical protein [Akkermansiaceae bacterium]
GPNLATVAGRLQDWLTHIFYTSSWLIPCCAPLTAIAGESPPGRDEQGNAIKDFFNQTILRERGATGYLQQGRRLTLRRMGK